MLRARQSVARAFAVAIVVIIIATATPLMKFVARVPRVSYNSAFRRCCVAAWRCVAVHRAL